MDDIYSINLAKTELREAYNTGDVERLLSVFSSEFTDMTSGAPSFFGADAKSVLRSRTTQLFAQYRVRFVVTIIAIRVFGGTAFDFGWHETTLTPKPGGAALTTRQRYFEVWQKDPDGKWRIVLYIDNVDLSPAMPDAELGIPQLAPGPGVSSVQSLLRQPPS
jgi:ketosteroid isomerase-like protein